MMLTLLADRRKQSRHRYVISVMCSDFMLPYPREVLERRSVLPMDKVLSKLTEELLQPIR